MRGVIVPPSKLIVKNNFPPKGFFIRGGLLLRGGDYYTILYYTILYYTILYYTILYYTIS